MCRSALSFTPTCPSITSLQTFAFALLPAHTNPFDSPILSYIPLSPSADRPTLFIDPRKLSSTVNDYLVSINIQTKPYSDVWSFLEALKPSSPPAYSLELTKPKEEGKIATSLTTSWAVELALGKVCPSAFHLPPTIASQHEEVMLMLGVLSINQDNVQPLLSPILEAKAIKNPIELKGMRAAYLRDGWATVRWMTKMERLIREEGKEVREFEAG